MDGLLTTREVQGLLKVDRLTVYRMLNDGRLTGIKIGHQWRFSQESVEALVSREHRVQQHEEAQAPVEDSVLPIHCVQSIQNVFAEVAEIGSLTAAPSGEPLSQISNSCEFCDLILSGEKGRQGCIASWRKLASQPGRRPEFQKCHAGLDYARARIEIDGRLQAILIAGQFYEQPPDSDEERERIAALADKYGIDPAALQSSAGTIRVIDERRRGQLAGWLESVAHMFEDIGRERAELMGRLRRIAAMTILESGMPD